MGSARRWCTLGDLTASHPRTAGFPAVVLNREVTDPSPWQTELLDLDAYLSRVGAPVGAPSRPALDALHEAWVGVLRERDLTAVVETERLAARERLTEAAEALRWVGLAIAAVMVLLLVAAAWGLRRGVLDPVSALADQVRAVVSGEVATTSPRAVSCTVRTGPVPGRVGRSGAGQASTYRA